MNARILFLWAFTALSFFIAGFSTGKHWYSEHGHGRLMADFMNGDGVSLFVPNGNITGLSVLEIHPNEVCRIVSVDYGSSYIAHCHKAGQSWNEGELYDPNRQ